MRLPTNFYVVTPIHRNTAQACSSSAGNDVPPPPRLCVKGP